MTDICPCLPNVNHASGLEIVGNLRTVIPTNQIIVRKIIVEFKTNQLCKHTLRRR